MLGIKEMVIIVLCVILFFTGVIWGAVWFNEAQCHARWRDQSVEWSILTGCMIMTDGRLVPESRLWFERNK